MDYSKVSKQMNKITPETSLKQLQSHFLRISLRKKNSISSRCLCCSLRTTVSSKIVLNFQAIMINKTPNYFTSYSVLLNFQISKFSEFYTHFSPYNTYKPQQGRRIIKSSLLW